MKTTRRVIQALVLVLGLAGAVAAFVSTPKIIRAGSGIVAGCPEVPTRGCTEDTEAAVLRGGGRSGSLGVGHLSDRPEPRR